MLVAFRCAPLDFPQVAGAGEAVEAGALVQQVFERRRRQFARELHKHAGVEVAGARRHHQAFERRHAHAGFDTAAVLDRGDARAVAQVARDHAQVLRAFPQVRGARAVT